MTDANATTARLHTDNPGLDSILDGGLPAPGLHLMGGPSGSRKTGAANQICVHRAAGVDVAADHSSADHRSADRILDTGPGGGA